MRKLAVVLLFILIITGCDSKINLNNYDSIFDTFLSSNTELVNNYSTGYKYYLPNGVKVLESKDFNDKLYFDGYNYYLYIDVISYYYNVDIDYTEDSSSYYSKQLEYNGKKGYVNISKIDDLYKVTMYYNYARIEAYVNENDIGSTLVNACYILNSIKLNHSIVELSVGKEDVNLIEETYDFYKPRKEGNFINYINQFDEYKEEVVNENNIGNEGN